MTPSFWRSRMGRNARIPLTTPPKLMSSTHSWSSIEPSATPAEVATPALLNTIPIGAGAQSDTSAAKASWAWRSRTSSRRLSTGVPIVSAVVSSPSSFWSTSASGHPCAARRWATARPIPDAAPDTYAVRPSTMICRRAMGLGRGLLALCRVGVGGDQFGQALDRTGGNVVAEATDRLEPCPRNRPCGGAPAGGMDHAVAIAVDDYGGGGDPPQISCPVAGLDDRCHLAGSPGRGLRVAVEGEPRTLTDLVRVGGKPVGADVPEHQRRALGCCLAIPSRLLQEQSQRGGRHPAGRARAGGGHDRDQAAHAVGVLGREGLGDHAAHGDADRVYGLEIERLDQPGRVSRHVVEVVLFSHEASGEELSHAGRAVGGVGGAADVAIVESDDVKAPVDEAADKRLGPGGQLLAEAHDQEQRGLAGVTDALTAQRDGAADIDDLLAHAATRSGARRGICTL